MSDRPAFEVRKDQPPVHQMAIPPPGDPILPNWNLGAQLLA